MPIIPKVGGRTWRVRLVVAVMYLVLLMLGTTMVVPFMITVSSSVANDFDYDRFRPVPRYVWSRSDRFMKGLVGFFNRYPQWDAQMRVRFHQVPQHWTSWRAAGRDIPNVDKVAAPYLHPTPAQLKAWRVQAADYAEFVEQYPIEDTVCALSDVEVTGYLRDKYRRLWIKQNPEAARRASGAEINKGALQLLGQTWGIPFEDFYAVGFEQVEMRFPVWQQSWFPPSFEKYRDFLELKAAYRAQYFTPGVRGRWLSYLREKGYRYENAADVFPVLDAAPADLRALWVAFKGEVAPAAPDMPFALRAVWYKYLDSEEVQRMVGLKPGQAFNVEVYNRLAGTDYKDLADTPFPLPASFPSPIRKIWDRFVETRYPIRLTAFHLSPEYRTRYQRFLENRFKTLAYANRMLGTTCTRWDEFELTGEPPLVAGDDASRRSVWMDFVKTLPVGERILSSSESRYQAFLLKKYGSLEKINQTYGWSLGRIEEAFPPFDTAYAVTFHNLERPLALDPVLSNYSIIAFYIMGRGNALIVTLVLVGLSVLCTLTINPMAAYALSRFNLKGKDKILLFALATMAFPAMVSAIPAYLLLRDLGLLNTFFALVLPGAANGMAIFMLKGFFDSLPQELYDAATIDGAREWQIFTVITLPMMKPILAINALHAFIGAYNSWQWALIICQKQSMWTLAVWMYQANQWWADRPWIVTAGFVIVSLPTLLVFLSCQKIILRGIILPSMK